ncbi:MAG: NADP-dependent malic enzyme [Rickettsiaceae bacterium]|nr:NADP-dependent malic enzyme [Rickettsiaceae bacterium]
MTANSTTPKYYKEALEYHKKPVAGKLSITPIKPMVTQEDLALAYSPGVAAPCLEIAKDIEASYDYTSRGNMVAVISNGTAVLGLGNIGAAASKPVMEGKAALFKRFADIDSVDIEVSTEDPQEFINSVKYLSASWGGINLEDIKAPECFIIEDELKKLMDIPVFHDDQHGTAIVVSAGLTNALRLTNRKLEHSKIIVNGAGAAAIACIELLKAMGAKDDNVILCDTKGTIYKGRKDGMNPWKEKHAATTNSRTLREAMVDADIFLGLSSKDSVDEEMVKSMAGNPIIFAMANPDPEITPERVKSVRSDAIMATGRSDYPNQINNVLCFPYIFRGALDIRAKEINIGMKIAASKALADIVHQPVSEEVQKIYGGRKFIYGPEYIIPVPFDPRLITTIPVAVAKAAIETNVAKKPYGNLEQYKHDLERRTNPTAYYMSNIFNIIISNKQRVVLAEGEDEEVIKAAITASKNGYAKPVLVGRMSKIEPILKHIGYVENFDIEVVNAANTIHLNEYIDYLYSKLQRKGYLYRDCARLVKTDRHIFASLMVQCNHADAIVTGFSNNYHNCLDEILRVIPKAPNQEVFSYATFLGNNKQIIIADTSVNNTLSAEQIASVAIQLAKIAKAMGHEPRVALIAASNFSNVSDAITQRVKDAVSILDNKKVDFVYEGELSVEAALNESILKLYPFSRLTQPANILVMPNLISASVSTQLLEEMSSGTCIGNVLTGISKSVQIVKMGSTANEIVNSLALAAYEAIILNKSDT